MNLVAGYTLSGENPRMHRLCGLLTSLSLIRAREIQAQEGLTPNLWGPPASGGSTPLRETIPESPSQDGFPDFTPPSETNPQTPARRARAGTVPSKFSPGNGMNAPQVLLPKTSRPTPSTSPFRPASMIPLDNSNEARQSGISPSTSTLLSRLRAGSMPQRVSYVGSPNPFGPSLFSTSWGSGRDRGTTLTSVRSSDTPDSPAQSSFSRDGLADADVKTLDYLGLAETPQQSQATLALSNMGAISNGSSTPMLQPFFTDIASFNKSMNRFRSYSVNAKEKYAEDEEDDYARSGPYSGLHSGTLTPSAASAAAALAATQAQIHQHNLAVQAFANQASASRPRARTAGVLDSPLRALGRGYLGTPSRLDNSISAADINMHNGNEYEGLPEAVRALRLTDFGGSPGIEGSEENGLEGPTRALWLGNIPTSTTVSSLQAIFNVYGRIESTRVLVHKNCGFVNFENLASAMQAKSMLNGKEIFPGAGPIRIGYAKAPSASAIGTPGNNGAYSSPSPDPHSRAQDGRSDQLPGHETTGQQNNGVHAQSAAAALHVPNLADLRDEMLKIVREFGGSEQDLPTVAASVDAAASFNNFEAEIPAVPEPSHTRAHDAPRLREIRKRIDNNAISQAEIEEIAIGMLPEIAELASDYLGNTVIQKLFEYCSESIKESMLTEIAPHLAEIGVHKNGTWAAQKIIDVARTPNQITMIVEHLRPYTVALFLDQYGNYVLQCCLRFGYPWNNFIFETMLNRLWEIAQGRFGARAMRACLESHHSTKDQQRMLASAIALHSVQLATNANGALLLTWLLDTCTFPRRRTVLAPRLTPHLVHLCTHKVAYLTVLKVINQRNEPEARDIVLQALFFSPDDKVLEDILSDQMCGANMIFKVLTTPFFDESMRSGVVQNVRNVLSRLKGSSSQGYKRLIDEVGLSSRVGKVDREHPAPNGHAYHERSRPVSQHGASNNHMAQPPMERQHSGQYISSIGQSQYTTPPTEPNGYDQFNINNAVFNSNPLSSQELQYQQAILARGISPASFYPSMSAMGPSGYGSPAASVASYRNLQGQGQNSPMPQQVPMSPNPMMQQPGFAPPGFNPLVGGGMMAGYQYPMQYFPQQVQQQAGGRRGRVSTTVRESSLKC